jgi:hypothetical protein
MMRFGDAPACLLAEIPRLHVRVFLKALLRRLASTGHCLLPSGFAGARAVAARRDGGDPLVATYGAALPLALACLQDDFEACIAHLRFPLAHRHIAADADALKAGVAQRKRELDAKLAEKQADRLEWEAGFAIDYAIGSVEQARLAVLDAIVGRVEAEEAKRS